MNTLLSKLSEVKLSITQLLIGSLAAIAGVLALLLKFKEEELRKTQVALLGAHFENSQQQFDKSFEAAHDKVLTSKEAYEKSLSAYNAVKSK